MPSRTELLFAAAQSSQAAYALFTSPLLNQAALTDPLTGQFTDTEALRFAGSANPSYTILSHLPSDLTGLSATVFHDNAHNLDVLAVRGTEPALSDLVQDAKLVAFGFASDQLLSLYRYYRRLTTPPDQPVQYGEGELDLLHRLNNPLSTPFIPSAFISNEVLDRSLSLDRGIRRDGSEQSVLQPNQPLIITGHSLGGHLAILFGRLFPAATQWIYTFNAPGIAPWGNVLLSSMGVGPNEPARVVNVVAEYGLDVTAALGTRPGTDYNIFIEGSTDASRNHSSVRLADSLALYDVIAKLTPGLADRIDEISSILAAASRKPGDSLERSLDDLRRLVGLNETPTPIALVETDQANRDVYYSRLYDLRDNYATRDWGISSLAGLNAATLASHASSDPAYRYALSELSPFVATGADAHPELMSLSTRWLNARADFLARLLEASTVDRMFSLSGTNANYLYADIDRDEKLAVLSPTSAIVAQNQGSDERLATYLDALVYQRKVIFGSNDPDHPDTIDGTSGADLLFGNAGDDRLTGGAGDDVLVGGTGANTLDGGAGFDVYSYDTALRSDTIHDSDGKGAIELAGAPLGGGYFNDDDDSYHGGGHTYALSGDVLQVDGVLTITGFHDGDLGIHLTRVPALEREFEFTSGGSDSVDFVIEEHFGNDVLALGRGMDFGFGGAGNDWIEGGDDPDFLMGGRGDDVVIADSASTNIDIPLGSPQPFDPNVGPLTQHFLSGGEGNDKLLGSGGWDFIEGGGGADLIIGGAGDDSILGDGAVISSVVSEDYSQVDSAGTPIATTYVAPQAFEATAEGFYFNADPVDGLHAIGYAGSFESPAFGDDEIYAGPGNDAVAAGGGDDVAHGGTGRDVIYGGSGSDRLYGDDDDDILFGDDAVAPLQPVYDPERDGSSDQLFGGAGNDRLLGQGGDDLLDGGTGDDALLGGEGNDTLMGGYGDDLLAGGAGADVLDGGPGRDSYLLGDSDRLILRFGEITSEAIAPDGAFPTTATIVLEDGFESSALTLVNPAPGIAALVLDQGTFILLAGDAADWAGLRFEFSDGETLAVSDVPLHSASFADLGLASSPFGSPGNDVLVGNTQRNRFAGGAGDDLYEFHAGDGRDSIDDSLGFDVLRFTNVAADDVQVVKSGADYVLRYPGGELRLIGEAQPDAGIDFVVFGASTFWTHADLDAHAVDVTDSQEAPLDVQSTQVGDSFSFTLPDEAFGGQHLLGDASYNATDLRGGALPAWLHFDAEHRALSGSPGEADVGLTTVAFGLLDGGELLSVAPLVIDVEAAPPPPPPPPPPPVEPPPTEPPVVEPPPQVETPPPIENAGPLPEDTPPSEPPEEQPPVAIDEPPPPVDTPPIDASPPVASEPPQEPPPVAVVDEPPPPVQTPPIDASPPVAGEPPQEPPPVAVVDEPPPADTPPVDASPPVASEPPQEQPPVVVVNEPPPVDTPPIDASPPVASEPPHEEPPVAGVEQPPEPSPPIETSPPIAEETPPAADTESEKVAEVTAPADPAIQLSKIAGEQAAAAVEEHRITRTTNPTGDAAALVADLVAVPETPTRTTVPAVAVGAIADPGYRQIENLLFAPAATHAPRFMERYADAIREFRERTTTLPERPAAPLPTDEEMGAYNAALHAWLDMDASRPAALEASRAGDDGSIPSGWVGAGTGFERLLASTTDAFARPGLAGLQSIQARPGLGEGLNNLGG